MIKLFRWTVRVLNIFILCIILAFIIGEWRGFQATWSDFIGIFFFPVGIAVGMITGFFRERTGGTIVICSLVMFYVVCFAVSGRFPQGIWFVVFSLPGILYLPLGMINSKRAKI